MREIPSEMEFHGFLGDLGNSDRSAHWIMGAGLQVSLFRLQIIVIPARLDFRFRLLFVATRVMEARFDSWIIRLPNRARAIGGVMFCREAWDALSELDSGPCCSRYHIAKGPVGGALRLELGPSHRPSRAGT